ncbi:ABC transporter permease [Candidatus Micrarchaeota archaeon]|nr:ABC transporter permease [Candidatus Micrarchaeota archaeon]
MIQTEAILTLWQREILRFVRNKSRIIGGLGTPLLFLLVLGSGFDRLLNVGGGLSYFQFLAPGVIGMVLLFGGMFSGINVVYDRQFGFLKEILVAPVSRASMVIGRTLGGATTAMFQAAILLVLTLLVGVQLDPVQIVLMVLAMTWIAFGFTAMGLAIAAKLTDFQGFQLIVNFIMMPMFFLSGALYPLDQLPPWLQTATSLNPMTYGVELMRFIALGQSSMDPGLALAIQTAFNALMLWLAAWLFSQKE